MATYVSNLRTYLYVALPYLSFCPTVINLPLATGASLQYCQLRRPFLPTEYSQ